MAYSESSTKSLFRALQKGKHSALKLRKSSVAGINYLGLCRNLIESGADLDVIEQRGTPCIPSVYWDVGLIKFFLDHGRDVNARDELGNTALIYAAFMALRNVVEFLLDNSADPNVRNINGETALYKLVTEFGNSPEASARVRVRIGKRLIEGGADVNLGNVQGLTLLHFKQLRFNPLILECVLDKFENIDIRASKSDYENTPLMVAARGKNVELCRALIERNADVKAQNCYGFTPLHYAVYSKSIECMRLLLASGSDQNIKSSSGLDAIDMHRFVVYSYERIFDLFEDSVKLIDVYENMGAEYILSKFFPKGVCYWEQALEMRSKFNLPKPEPTEKQKTIYKIQDSIRTFQQLKNLSADREAMYRQAMLTIERISNGSSWQLLRIPIFLLRLTGPYDIIFRLITEILQHISENIVSEVINESMNEIGNFEFDKNILQSFMDKFLDSSCPYYIRKVCFPFVLNILYGHFLRIKLGDRFVFNEFNWTLTLAKFAELFHSNDQILRSNFQEFYTKFSNLGTLRNEYGDTDLHLACRTSINHYFANVLVDCGANVKELNRKNQEPIQLLNNGKNINCGLVLKMVLRGAHFDAKPEDPDYESAFEVPKRKEINTLPYDSLQCMAARVLARSFIHYKDVLPPKLTKFVDLHFYGFGTTTCDDDDDTGDY